MADVISKAQGLTFSISSLAREFGITRETVSKRLKQADVKPVDQSGGFPVYKLLTSARAILEIDRQEVAKDPSMMTPKERLDWFRSETERLRFEQETGYLILTEDARKEMASIIQIVTRTIDVIPDVLERDCQLDSETLGKVEQVFDALRNQLADELES